MPIERRVVVDEAQWNAIWDEGYKKLDEWLRRSSGETVPAWKLEHAMRIYMRIKGLCDGTYKGEISTM